MNILVEDWRKLWKTWSVQFAVLGAVLPEILQLIADNTSELTWLNDGYKSGIRLTCLILVVLARPLRQSARHDEAEKQDPV